MKIAHFFTLIASCALVACSGSGGGGSKAIYHPDVGPFDENGDYVAALADAPVTRNFFARSKSKKKTKSSSRTRAGRARRASSPPQVAQVAPPVQPAPVAPTRVASTPTPAVAPRTVVITQSPAPVTRAQTVRAVPTPAAAPRPAPKPVVMKPKKKAPVRHVVRKSDTLFGLSRKYGVSVGSIQRANNLKGTTIITGKSLLIPR